MPLCEGLPHGPCPKKAKGKTVKLTQASLSQPTVIAANNFVSVRNDQTKFTVDINRTVSDIARRRKSVIISGVHEQNLSADAENKAADEIAFNDLCEINLPVKHALGPVVCR